MLLIIINSIFISTITVLIAYIYIAISSKNWGYVIGKVLSTSIQRHSRPPKRIGAPMYETTFSASINYEYAISGKRYVGTRIRFGVINREYDSEDALYEDLGFSEVGNINVYYFKYIPSISVIKPNDTEISLYVALIIFCIAGMFAFRFYYNMLAAY